MKAIVATCPGRAEVMEMVDPSQPVAGLARSWSRSGLLESTSLTSACAA